jgi:hypothetical protein
MVDENPIKSNKGGGGPAVGPGELSVAQGEFDEPKDIDSVVEQVRLRGGEICIIPVRRVMGEVEITSNNPRDIVSRVMES